ncbi:MAG TPA: hypothetical protein VGL66_06450 [Caulobacteraceae bacterium]|jgi:hypothetical protein
MSDDWTDDDSDDQSADISDSAPENADAGDSGVSTTPLDLSALAGGATPLTGAGPAVDLSGDTSGPDPAAFSGANLGLTGDPAVLDPSADANGADGAASGSWLEALASGGFDNPADRIYASPTDSQEKFIPQVLADSAGASGAVAQSLVPPPGADGESGAQTSVPVVAQAGANGPPLVNPNTGQPYPDGVHSEGGWLVDGKGALADPDTGRALAYASNGRTDLSHAVHRPGPTERDPVIAQIAAQHPGMNPPGLVVDPETGVMKRYVPGKPGAGPTLVPVTADEQQ